MFRHVLAAALVVLPATAFAVGGGDDDDEPPTPTSTTTECPEGTVYSSDAGGCVVIQDSQLDDDALYDAARELAYAGRHGDALSALAAMSDPRDTRVLTYQAFIARSLGDGEGAFALYAQALLADPDNLLARSYLGMAHVQDGAVAEARVQLAEIRARGGAGSWPDRALARAIRTGVVVNY